MLAARETKMLSAERMERMIDAPTNDEAAKILEECGYGADVLEMPYRPPLRGSGLPGEKAYSYRLGGPTCLAGDIIGDYSFDRPLAVGDVLEFGDMAIYSMVKNNTFNGMPLPSIALRTLDGTERCIRSFGYEDFKQRLS